jgi:hypothetical protein
MDRGARPTFRKAHGRDVAFDVLLDSHRLCDDPGRIAAKALRSPFSFRPLRPSHTLSSLRWYSCQVTGASRQRPDATIGRYPSIVLLLVLSLALPIQILRGRPADQQVRRTNTVSVGENEGTFLVLSDIHFDPISGTDPQVLRTLASSPVERWQAILQSSTSQRISLDGEDSNYALLSSALRAAGNSGRYDYILVPGDNLGHNFLQKYRAFRPGGQGYAEFAIKTLIFIDRMIQRQFPGVPIYQALGNNDSAFGDYSAPGHSLLAALSKEWSGFAGRASAARDFSSGGYYAVPHPTVPSQELIVLNTSIWSRLYSGGKSPDDADAGSRETEWLSSTLDRVRAQGHAATLLMHIPPGIDAYATVGQGVAGICAMPTLLWKRPYLDSFLAIILSHKDILRDSYAGHLHINDFRIFTDPDGAPYLQTNIAPSLSPEHHDPEFEIGVYDKVSGALVDYAVESLPSASPTGAPANAAWQTAYDFRALSQMPSYSPSSLQAISLLIRSSDTTRSRLFNLFTAHMRAALPISAKDWLPYSCAQTQLTPDAFTSCSCPSGSNR